MQTGYAASLMKMLRTKDRIQMSKNEMMRLTHQDVRELLTVWEGCHWDDNQGGWLDLELCARARR